MTADPEEGLASTPNSSVDNHPYKTFNNSSEATKKGADSETNVYKPIPMGRVVASIRCRPEIKEALIKFCEANGLSLCHLFEGLATGFLYGLGQQIEFVNKSPTINLTLVREVKRLRRLGVSAAENFYDGSVGVWTHVDGELNANGHGVGCACSLCCPTVLKHNRVRVRHE
jgi:hypothetical protein